MNKNLNLLSRFLLAAIFVVSGCGKIANFHGMVAMASSAGLPLPAFAIAIAALVEIIAGLALLVGWQVRWASLTLIAFLIPATLVFHAAHLGDAGQSSLQMVEVLKNLAIMGGLLKFYASAVAGERYGAEPASQLTTIEIR